MIHIAFRRYSRMQSDEQDGSSSAIEPWRLQWDAKHINRFWDWMARGRSGREEVYFSETVGDDVLDTVAKHIPLRGVVLDLGAARGFLVTKLLTRGLSVIAVDSSPDSVRSIAEMNSGRDRFLGARLGGVEAIPADDASVDVAFLLEVVEHLDDAVLRALFPELRRVLKPDGAVVITTPNDELLSEFETICPHCGCQYHTMQHVRSWTAASLAKTMEGAGFRMVLSKAMLFSRYRNRVMGALQMLNVRLRGRKPPHLVYIGRRT